MIKVENLTYIYNRKTHFSKTAVDNISVEINDGDFLGIIGHTGSGKSTFIQHINALLKATSGKIVVGDIDLSQRKIPYKELRKRVGMVFQYPEQQLFAKTIEQDVAFALNNFFVGKKSSLSKDEITQKVKDALALVDMDYEVYAQRSPFELSGGQKRRVALAGTLVAMPEILILDEPTAGLDPRGKQEIYQLLHNLQTKFVKTIIIVSHDMNEIATNCNRVLVFKDGKIVYDLPPKELFLHCDHLAELNLEVPQTTKIANLLCNSGINVPMDIFSAIDLADNIYEKIKL